jgi:hypothetical protein
MPCKQRGKRYGLQTMCEGGGMANVTICWLRPSSRRTQVRYTATGDPTSIVCHCTHCQKQSGQPFPSMS